MIVAFDYLEGPVLGHAARCNLLREELLQRGHIIVNKLGASDWLVVDYPPDQLPAPKSETRRLLMGHQPVYFFDYAWHPLGSAGERVLTGAQYIIVDPAIAEFPPKYWANRNPLLITCGGADPFHLTEKLIEMLKSSYVTGVIIGPNFNRAVRVPDNWSVYENVRSAHMPLVLSDYRDIIATWGNTVFEGLAVGARVIPITTQPEHPAEARKLRMPFIQREHLYDYALARLLATAPHSNYGVDGRGVYRVVDWLEAHV
jgi:hypothetical protein